MTAGLRPAILDSPPFRSYIDYERERLDGN